MRPPNAINVASICAVRDTKFCAARVLRFVEILAATVYLDFYYDITIDFEYVLVKKHAFGKVNDSTPKMLGQV
jgi:hypothetical protein